MDSVSRYARRQQDEFALSLEWSPFCLSLIHICAKAWEQPILAADGVYRLGTPEAKKAGLSGIDEKTTPADKGPIKDGLRRFGVPAGYKLDIGCSIRWDLPLATGRAVL